MFGTSSVLKQVRTPIINIVDTDIRPSSTVYNLGCVQDNRLKMEQHINKVCQAGFYHLRNIRKVRCYLTEEVTEQMVHASVKSRLDQSNSLLYCISNCLLKKLQRVHCSEDCHQEQQAEECHSDPHLAPLVACSTEV